MSSLAESPSGAIVVPCSDLSEALAFYCEQLGFRVERISPADDPERAVVVGMGIRLLIERNHEGPAPTLCLEGQPGPPIDGPDGVRILRLARPEMVLPKLKSRLTICRAEDGPSVEGRAGMSYRDLIPDRGGGRFVASLIRVEDAGPVPDYVHFHDVRLQLIHCLRGWVRLVYEDQGPPFVVHPGDCVLQPPGIRHQVLESSAGLEVLEFCSPARHDTFGDLELGLPNTVGQKTGRLWRDQRFVHHQAKRSPWRSGEWPGWEVRDCGIGAATLELGSLRVHRFGDAQQPPIVLPSHSGEVRFLFVDRGALVASCPVPESLERGDAITVPPGLEITLSDIAEGTEIVEVQM